MFIPMPPAGQRTRATRRRGPTGPRQLLAAIVAIAAAIGFAVVSSTTHGAEFLKSVPPYLLPVVAAIVALVALLARLGGRGQVDHENENDAEAAKVPEVAGDDSIKRMILFAVLAVTIGGAIYLISIQ